MITYAYWILTIALIALIGFLTWRFAESTKITIFSTVFVLTISWVAYYFHFQQVFVKRYGGVMTVTVPTGMQHIAATWKDDNLWIENYDPATNTCYFNEYSKGNLLEGKVTIKNCNPISTQR